MQKYLFSFIALVIISLLSAQTIVYAQSAGCKSLYGGGITKEQACNGETVVGPTAKPAAKATPTPTKAKPTPTKAPTTTKGGLPVVSPSPVKTTPSTGPELLGLIALAPVAAAGIYLRKRK